MKRAITLALSLSLLAGAAAIAQPYEGRGPRDRGEDGGGRGPSGGRGPDQGDGGRSRPQYQAPVPAPVPAAPPIARPEPAGPPAGTIVGRGAFTRGDRNDQPRTGGDRGPPGSAWSGRPTPGVGQTTPPPGRVTPVPGDVGAVRDRNRDGLPDAPSGGWDRGRPGRGDDRGAGYQGRPQDGQPRGGDWRPNYDGGRPGDPGRPGGWDRDRSGGDRGRPGGWDRNPGDGQYRDRDRGRPHFDPRRYGGAYHAERRFRAQPYRYPRGFYVRSWSLGQVLPYGWYGSSYYLNAYAYGLPQPPIGCEWVRVGDDAYLVDVWSGEVLSIAYDLFW